MYILLSFFFCLAAKQQNQKKNVETIEEKCLDF